MEGSVLRHLGQLDIGVRVACRELGRRHSETHGNQRDRYYCDTHLIAPSVLIVLKVVHLIRCGCTRKGFADSTSLVWVELAAENCDYVVIIRAWIVDQILQPRIKRGVIGRWNF